MAKLNESKKQHTVLWQSLTAFLAFTVLVANASAAPREKVLHSFNNTVGEGFNPRAGLIFDTAGNLYGTTTNDGTYGCGSVFELMPESKGGWKEKVLHLFNCGIGHSDGAIPYGPLTLDAVGNLYGMTFSGGDRKICPSGCGTIFTLMPQANGGWVETRLHAFTGSGSDGVQPYDGVTVNRSLYGTTGGGGVYHQGTVFSAPTTTCQPCGITIHSFDDQDGDGPESGVIFDDQGNLYGTASFGGDEDQGTIFELTPPSWTVTVLHSFNYSSGDGVNPFAGLVFDSGGNLYGTTGGGGAYDQGTVFELTPESDGTWTETILHNFNGQDGSMPYSTLLLDAKANLYGTTYSGGANDLGTVFELVPNENGGWTERFFSFNGANGSNPYPGLTFGSGGSVYGTTYGGGAYGYGTVFEITP